MVVGGTRRVGRWVSETLLDDGWRVLAIYRENEQAALEYALAQQAAGRGPAAVYPADAGDPEQARAAVEKSGIGEFDVLVCAGGMSIEAALSATSAEQLEALWRSNVLAVHNMVSAALPRLRRAPLGRGRIITFSMVGVGHKAFRDMPAYAACKAMLESYTRSLAKELHPDNITVNCIALGMTELPSDGAPDYTAGPQSSWQRIGQSDLAALIRYLVSEESGGMTGAVIPLSGGFGL